MGLKIGIVTEYYYYPLLGGISENVHNTDIWLRQKGHAVMNNHTTSNSSNDFPDSDIISVGRSISIYSNGSMALLPIGARLLSELKKAMPRVFDPEKPGPEEAGRQAGGQIAVSRSCIDALKPFIAVRARITPNGVDVADFNPNVPGFRDSHRGKPGTTVGQ